MGGADILEGGDGNDGLSTIPLFGSGVASPGSLMIGGAGHDSLASGNSNDTMLGGDGDDTFQIQNFATTRVIDGGAGGDFLMFNVTSGGFASGVFFDLGKGTQAVAPGVIVTVTNVENLRGSQGNDTLLGDMSANRLEGVQGDDWLYGGGGDDWLDGGEGNNVLNGAEGVDTVFYNAASTVSVSLRTGTATSVTASGNSTDSLSNIENVRGTTSADVIEGDSGSNYLQGIGGDDVIEGGAGQDFLDGGEGADTFVFKAGDSSLTAPDTILFFAANDRIGFLDGPAGDVNNYVELAAPDTAAVDALFAGSDVRYVAMQSGANVYLFADLGDEGGTYDEVIILAWGGTPAIDATSILGL
jgi:Ca2+-binding RTX toxin-like protein